MNYKKNIKRIIDIFISIVILFSLIPIIFIICILIKLSPANSVFFIQQRQGLSGKDFKIIKFCTMLDKKHSDGSSFEDKDRIYPLGQFLRSTSLDEIPSLWNVFKGDMSLVGPRPLLMEYVPLYNAEQSRRMAARPGITGWAQVNGRNAISWEEKFKLDVWYIDNQSFWLDLRILFITVKKVLIRDGIAAAGEATMPKFNGTNNDT